MTYGLLPPEKENREIDFPKGQNIAGCAIGIITGDFWYPLLPGMVGNATTFNFPVIYKVLTGTTTWQVVKGDPSLLDAIIKGGKELQKQGVRAITGACGYFANYQNEIAAALDVPVFMSPLLQVPIVQRALKPNQKIGVICAVADALKTETLHQMGVNPSDIVVAGCQSSAEFRKGTNDSGSLNWYIIEQDLVNIAKELVVNNPEIGALVLECADLPACAYTIQNAVRLPVFDFSTMLNWVFDAVVRRPFVGFM